MKKFKKNMNMLGEEGRVVVVVVGKKVFLLFFYFLFFLNMLPDIAHHVTVSYISTSLWK